MFPSLAVLHISGDLRAKAEIAQKATPLGSPPETAQPEAADKATCPYHYTVR
jgi:hypothetical protein